MISYLPIKHILDCKAFLFFNTVYPSLLKCLINKMKPFMALMSHSTNFDKQTLSNPLVQSQQFSYRLILVKHCGVTFSLSQSTEFVGSHEEPMLLITSSITNPKVSFPSSSASSMEAAIFKDLTNCTKNGERPFTNPQYTNENGF